MAPRQLNPQEMDQFSRMFFELTHDEKYRPHMAKLVSHKYPQLAPVFNDVKQEERVRALEAKLEQKEQLARANEMQRALDRQREKLIEDGRYTAEQTQEIKQIIDRHGGTLDYNQAAVLYAHEKPPVNYQDGPPEDQRMGSTWEFPTVNGRDGKPIPFADFAKNPNTAAHNAAYQVITEFKKRSGVRV